jgi:hypothetical protein
VESEAENYSQHLERIVHERVKKAVDNLTLEELKKIVTTVILAQLSELEPEEEVEIAEIIEQLKSPPI